MLKEHNASFVFATAAADVVQCGGHEMSHRTPSIVQFIFS